MPNMKEPWTLGEVDADYIDVLYRGDWALSVPRFGPNGAKAHAIANTIIRERNIGEQIALRPEVSP